MLDYVGELLEDESEGWRRAEEIYRALDSPLEENQLREALWKMMTILKGQHVRYPKIFLRRANEIKEGKWHPRLAQPVTISSTPRVCCIDCRGEYDGGAKIEIWLKRHICDRAPRKAVAEVADVRKKAGA